MRKIAYFLLLALAVGSAGCGSQAPSTAPLTEEQKQRIQAEDKAIDDEEKSGSGTAVHVKKKR